MSQFIELFLKLMKQGQRFYLQVEAQKIIKYYTNISNAGLKS